MKRQLFLVTQFIILFVGKPLKKLNDIPPSFMWACHQILKLIFKYKLGFLKRILWRKSMSKTLLIISSLVEVAL